MSTKLGTLLLDTRSLKFARGQKKLSYLILKSRRPLDKFILILQVILSIPEAIDLDKITHTLAEKQIL